MKSKCPADKSETIEASFNRIVKPSQQLSKEIDDIGIEIEEVSFLKLKLKKIRFNTKIAKVVAICTAASITVVGSLLVYLMYK